MNSRGKRLTDFEIFKAKLQDSKALKSACENDYTEIVKYIGRFNNEYCDLFYQLDTQNFDKMMMRFVQDTIKYDHYIATIKKGKTAEELQDDEDFAEWLSGSNPNKAAPFGDSQVRFNYRICDCFEKIVEGTKNHFSFKHRVKTDRS